MGKRGREQASDGRCSPEQAFGFVLRRVRRRRNISQQRLADKSGYHRTYISLLERGEKSPSLRTIFDLATTLDVKPSELLKSVERVAQEREELAVVKS